MRVVRGLPRVFRDAGAILAESIVWDPAGFVPWCDITAGLLYRCPIEGLRLNKGLRLNEGLD